MNNNDVIIKVNLNGNGKYDDSDTEDKNVLVPMVYLDHKLWRLKNWINE